MNVARAWGARCLSRPSTWTLSSQTPAWVMMVVEEGVVGVAMAVAMEPRTAQSCRRPQPAPVTTRQVAMAAMHLPLLTTEKTKPHHCPPPPPPPQRQKRLGASSATLKSEQSIWSHWIPNLCARDSCGCVHCACTHTYIALGMMIRGCGCGCCCCCCCCCCCVVAVVNNITLYVGVVNPFGEKCCEFTGIKR